MTNTRSGSLSRPSEICLLGTCHIILFVGRTLKPCHSVISSSITTMLRELDSATENSFGVMGRTAWPTLNQVSGQSAYVADLVTAVEGVVDAVRPLVEQKKYLKNLFDKTSG